MWLKPCGRLSVAFVCLLAAACFGSRRVEGRMDSVTYKYVLPRAQPDWWHSAIIYQIYPRSFMDSNGDGIGDIQGITSRLQYLKDLGVTGIWLSPIYASPQADFGYDISDFKSVHPEYGTMADVEDMIRRCHELGLKVIFDIVPNHTSDEHEWFQRSVAGDSKYRDYYVWHEGNKTTPAPSPDGRPSPPNNWVSLFRFSAWTWNEQRQAYYLHQFDPKQPDLNYRNPHVVEEIKEVFRFWMDKGVDGFRVDAVPFLVEDELFRDEPMNEDVKTGVAVGPDDYGYLEHVHTMDLPETYALVREWRQLVDAGGGVMMTEVYSTLERTLQYYGTRDQPGAHFTFNFELLSRLSAASDAHAFKRAIDRWLAGMEDWRWPNWVMGNHDTKRVATRLPGLADAVNMILLSLPGVAISYNGEEIGMEDTFIKWEETKDPLAINKGPEEYQQVSRDQCRTPFQWNSSTSAGFSTNRKTWMPTNPNFWRINVEKEEEDDNSHLKVYKYLTEARRTEIMQKGDTETSVVGDSVLKIERSLEGSGKFVTLVNLGSWEAAVQLPAAHTVRAASVNSARKRGDTVEGPLSMRPKEALLLVSPAL